MAESSTYTPPKVWQWNKDSGGRFANINRPIAGATHEHDLPVGKHPLQLYSLATPNGIKVTILLEELLELGIKEAEYDAYLIDIMKGEQFGSGFVALNPNSKSPPSWIRAPNPRPAFLSPVRSSLISRKNLEPFCRPHLLHERNVCPGCSGRWEARRISAGGSGISMPTPRRRSN